MEPDAISKEGGFMLSKTDYKLLCTFRSPREIAPDELEDVERLVSRHLLAQGMDLDPDRHIVLSTARLSILGKRVLDIETETKKESFLVRMLQRLSIT